MVSLPFLSKAQLEAENEIMVKAKQPEDIAPLIRKWLEEYKNIPAMGHGELNAVAQETLGGKYKLAQRMATILQERAEMRRHGELNTMQNEHLVDEFRQVTAHMQESLTIISDVKRRNQLLQQIIDDQNVSSRSDQTNVTASTSPTRWPNENNTPRTYVNADPRKRVLREMNREAQLREISTNVQSENHVEPMDETEVSGVEETSTDNIVDSNNIINVVNDGEEIAISSLDDIESVAAYVTVSTSPETEHSMNSAESDRTANTSTPTPAPSPPMASTPTTAPSPPMTTTPAPSPPMTTTPAPSPPMTTTLTPAPSPPMASSTPKRVPMSPNDENAVRYTVIGPNGTKVPTEKFKAISFTTCSIATRSLLCMIFPEEVLATHTLSGKPSPAFLKSPRKGQLDPTKVADIIHCVTYRTSCNEKEVRMTITTKCADSTKKFRRLSRTPMRRLN